MPPRAAPGAAAGASLGGPPQQTAQELVAYFGPPPQVRQRRCLLARRQGDQLETAELTFSPAIKLDEFRSKARRALRGLVPPDAQLLHWVVDAQGVGTWKPLTEDSLQRQPGAPTIYVQGDSLECPPDLDEIPIASAVTAAECSAPNPSPAAPAPAVAAAFVAALTAFVAALVAALAGACSAPPPRPAVPDPAAAGRSAAAPPGRLARGSSVQLSDAGERRFYDKPRGPNWLRPEERGTITRLGEQGGCRIAIVRGPRGKATYWADEVMWVDPATPAAPRPRAPARAPAPASAPAAPAPSPPKDPDTLVVIKNLGGPLGALWHSGTTRLKSVLPDGAVAVARGHRFVGRRVTYVDGEAVKNVADIVRLSEPRESVRLRFAPRDAWQPAPAPAPPRAPGHSEYSQASRSARLRMIAAFALEFSVPREKRAPLPAAAAAITRVITNPWLLSSVFVAVKRPARQHVVVSAHRGDKALLRDARNAGTRSWTQAFSHVLAMAERVSIKLFGETDDVAFHCETNDDLVFFAASLFVWFMQALNVLDRVGSTDFDNWSAIASAHILDVLGQRPPNAFFMALGSRTGAAAAPPAHSVLSALGPSDEMRTLWQLVLRRPPVPSGSTRVQWRKGRV